ncbi:MAG: hypothetical protein J6J04_04385 [Oscillospiraceae bacterium]|nr:hypothetical protein [Oscillospiraceae bacterium]
MQHGQHFPQSVGALVAHLYLNVFSPFLIQVKDLTVKFKLVVIRIFGVGFQQQFHIRHTQLCGAVLCHKVDGCHVRQPFQCFQQSGDLVSFHKGQVQLGGVGVIEGTQHFNVIGDLHFGVGGLVFLNGGIAGTAGQVSRYQIGVILQLEDVLFRDDYGDGFGLVVFV